MELKMNQFEREEWLIGKEGLSKLRKAKLAVYGIGGVGSFVCEGLARAGIGEIALIDGDKIEETNLNRQIHALHSTLGKDKAQAMKERILDICPETKVYTYARTDFAEGEETLLEQEKWTYVVDAVDTISTKLKLIEKATKRQIPIISCMGTGNKMDPSLFRIEDIFSTSVCPLAKVMRKELRQRGITKLKVLYSTEVPKPRLLEVQKEERKQTPSSISFVPSVAGLLIAGEVIRDILETID